MEEEERIKRLGYDKIREEEEAKKVKESEAEERRKAKSTGMGGEGISRGSTPNGVRAAAEVPKPARLGFGQVIGQASAPVVKT
jgi:ADP-ribosylation factor GTPase-activating protein 2/3